MFYCRSSWVKRHVIVADINYVISVVIIAFIMFLLMGVNYQLFSFLVCVIVWFVSSYCVMSMCYIPVLCRKVSVVSNNEWQINIIILGSLFIFHIFKKFPFSAVLISLDVWPSRNLKFYNVLAWQCPSFCNRARLTFQAFCVVAQLKRWVVSLVFPNWTIHALDLPLKGEPFTMIMV